MKHLAAGSVKSLALMAAWAALGAFAAPGAEKTPPAPDLRVKVETPAPQLRRVSPEDVKKAFEELQLERNAQATPTAQKSAASAPAVSTGSVWREPTPVPLIPPSPLKLDSVAMPRLRRVGDPTALAVPPWSPQWSRGLLDAARQGQCAEAVVEYDWPGLCAAVRLVPQDPAQTAVRLLLNHREAEALSLAPGVWQTEVEAWLPDDPAPAPMCRLEAKEFRRGYQYTLRFTPDVAEKARDYIAEVRKRQVEPFREAQPVVVETTPPETERRQF